MQGIKRLWHNKSPIRSTDTVFTPWRGKLTWAFITVIFSPINTQPFTVKCWDDTPLPIWALRHLVSRSRQTSYFEGGSLKPELELHQVTSWHREWDRVRKCCLNKTRLQEKKNKFNYYQQTFNEIKCLFYLKHSRCTCIDKAE